MLASIIRDRLGHTDTKWLEHNRYAYPEIKHYTR